MDKLVMTEDFELYSQMKKGDREAFNTLFLNITLCYVLLANIMCPWKMRKRSFRT